MLTSSLRMKSREYRGPGSTRVNSPFRDRSVEENLALFEKMRAGSFEEGYDNVPSKSITSITWFIVIRY